MCKQPHHDPRHDIVEYVKRYETDQRSPYERYASWRYCFDHFGGQGCSEDSELTKLRLGFFLASWGMYRGSGFLLKLDETVHKGIAEIVHRTEFKGLHGHSPACMEAVKIEEIANLYEAIEAYYIKRAECFSIAMDKKQNATATLVTKVMLGTMGCIIAFDNYAVSAIRKTAGLRNMPVESAKSKTCLRKKTIRQLWQFYFCNKDSFDEAQRLIREYRKDQGWLCQPDYPPMKLLDMYLWKIGEELEPNIDKS